MEDDFLIERLLYRNEGDTLDFKLQQSPFDTADDDSKSALLKAILRSLKLGGLGVPVTLSVLHRNPAFDLYDQLGFQFVAELPKSTHLIWRTFTPAPSVPKTSSDAAPAVITPPKLPTSSMVG